jgi:hypothetical protein
MIHALPRSARAGVLAAVLLCAATALQAAEPAAELRQFAREVGIADAAAFAETVQALRAEGRLPRQYITKRRAEELGWRAGRDLCAIAGRDAIGGDRFRDRRHALPNSGRRWREADLDERCGLRRGSHRLIWSDDGLIYVTTDHYQSFVPVPGTAR